MPACPKCGAQVAEEVKFCGSCGSPIAPSASAPGVPPSPPISMPPGPPVAAASGGIAPNVAAMLIYLPVCFIGLICAILFGFMLDPYKQNRFIRFHADQSIALHVAYIVIFIAWLIVSFILTAIGRIFALITFPINMLLCLGFLILMIVCMVKAYGNATFKVPVIGDWAEKQANR